MDYVNIALESLIEENVMMRNITINRMIAESEFILMSMESGEIKEFVQEASMRDTAKKVLEALRKFIDSIISMFRRKTVEKYKKYIDWVQEKSEKIEERAAKSSVTMAKYWDGDWASGQSTIETLINEAFKTPYKDDDVSFATKVLPSIKTKEDLNDTGKVSAALKNKFRFGIDESDNKKIEKVTVSNNNLVEKSKDMVDYVLNYEDVSKGLSRIKTKWENGSKQFYATQESDDLISKDTFLLVENTKICNSDLSLLSGFESLPVFEADGDKQNESLTTVQNNTINNENSGAGKGNSINDRYKMVDKFVRLAFSAYLTACEERFIVYIKCISQILGESPKK